MEIIRTVREMQAASATVKRAGRRVALVPTMGALHEGHVALMRQARSQGGAVVVSIYVNPTQFGPQEDFKQYPRDLEADGKLCQREQVDAVFAPSDDEMYPGGIWQTEASAPSQTAVPKAHGRDARATRERETAGSGQATVPGAILGMQYSTFIDETVLAQRFEGARRPGHFRGVCTVVAKLFNIVQPDLAVFGQKDYQQLKIVQRMVRDLCYPIEILVTPTVREPDGLAMSSRNQMLSGSERAQATVLWKALSVARDLFNEGEHNAHRLEAAMQRTVALAPAARLDYAQIVNADSLEPVPEVQRGNVVLLAAHVGKVRLIDNLIL